MSLTGTPNLDLERNWNCVCGTRNVSGMKILQVQIKSQSMHPTDIDVKSHWPYNANVNLNLSMTVIAFPISFHLSVSYHFLHKCHSPSFLQTSHTLHMPAKLSSQCKLWFPLTQYLNTCLWATETKTITAFATCETHKNWSICIVWY